jgi:hypothetical protein
VARRARKRRVRAVTLISLSHHFHQSCITLHIHAHTPCQYCAAVMHFAQRRYLELVTAAAEVYGKNTGFFLACGYA